MGKKEKVLDLKTKVEKISDEHLSDLKKDVSKLKQENPIIDTKEEIEELKRGKD